MKKTVSLLLLLTVIFSLVACGGNTDGAPEGYKLASNSEVCSYSLYVPEAWTSESEKSDYTMAKISSLDPCSVSLAVLDGVYAETMADYWTSVKDSYHFLTDMTVIEEGAQATIGSGESVRQGYRYVFSGKYGDTTYRYMQIFFTKGGLDANVYCFTYTALDEHYDAHLEVVQTILQSFKFN